jgi:hypothetical protein
MDLVHVTRGDLEVLGELGAYTLGTKASLQFTGHVPIEGRAFIDADRAARPPSRTARAHGEARVALPKVDVRATGAVLDQSHLVRDEACAVAAVDHPGNVRTTITRTRRAVKGTTAVRTDHRHPKHHPWRGQPLAQNY